MTTSTNPRTLPTDTGATPRERWNRLDKPAMHALAALMSNDERAIFGSLHHLSGEYVTLTASVAAIRARTQDPSALRPAERADVVRLIEVERLILDANARAHVVLDRHGIGR